MTRSELFYNYVETCFDKLLKSLEEYSTTGERKLLFRFRVSIKKIRASLLCIEKYYGKKDFKQARKEFKKMFREGGYLRELQIYQDWFKRHHLLRLSKSIDLEKRIHQIDNNFMSSKDKTASVIRKNKKMILNYSKKISQEEVLQFYVQLLQDRIGLLNTVSSPKKEWHGMRKEFKRILYARHWQENRGLRLVSKRQAVFLDQYQHLIGYWHDNEDMIRWVQEQQAEYGKGEADDMQSLYKKAYTLLKAKSAYFEKKVKEKQTLCIPVMATLFKRLLSAQGVNK